MVRIAVIMSIYKNEKMPIVEEAISSILSQKDVGFDFYIQFDGPIDNQVELYVRSLSSENIHIYERETNEGLAKSLNNLLRHVLTVGYEYIARMDADDISLPERLSKQMAYMDQHKDIECLGTWAIEINNDGREYYKKSMPVTHDECIDLFMKRDCMIHPTVMFRKSFFSKAGFYPEDTYFGEDTIMWAKGFKAGCRFGNIPEYLLKFRMDDNFFKRRRGFKHAWSILCLRCKVNKMLHFGVKSYYFASLYAIAKMMPKSVLNIIYKKAR